MSVELNRKAEQECFAHNLSGGQLAQVVSDSGRIPDKPTIIQRVGDVCFIIGENTSFFLTHATRIRVRPLEDGETLIVRGN